MAREYLKRLRSVNKMTQADVACAAGMSVPAYCLVENSQRKKSLDVLTLTKLAKAFGINFEDIVNDEKRYGEGNENS